MNGLLYVRTQKTGIFTKDICTYCKDILRPTRKSCLWQYIINFTLRVNG
jgi:hypothetical protein